MKFKIEQKPFDDDRIIFSKTEIGFEPNSINCLVGCNGSGKTTLVKLIQNQLKHLKFEEIVTDLLGKRLKDFFSLENDSTEPVGYYFSFDKKIEAGDSSTVEFSIARLLRNFVSTGESVIRRLGDALIALKNWIKSNFEKELVIFFDDCDVGTSIDCIDDIIEVINLIIEECKNSNITYYIILTANSYELCKQVNCIDVHNFKPIAFKNYDDYRNFVLESRKIKDETLTSIGEECGE